jgi:hypothetical protein
MKDWKKQISRSRVGEKVDLKSIEGFWIKPRKFSVSENDEVEAQDKKATLDAGVSLKDFASAAIKVSKQKENSEESLEGLSDKETEALLNSQFTASAGIIRLSLLYGIAEHNFCEEESTTKIDEAIVKEIMQIPEIASEMTTIVRNFNRPLAKKTSGTSETSQSGSTEEANSTSGTPSLTEGSPQT